MSDIGPVRREVVLEPLPEHPTPEPAPGRAPEAPTPAHRGAPAVTRRTGAVTS